MNDDISVVRSRLRSLGGSNNVMPAMNGRVMSVDKANYTCVVEFDNGDSINATLTCGDTTKGIVQVPKINSDVIVVCFDRVNAVVVMCDEIEQVIINGGELG